MPLQTVPQPVISEVNAFYEPPIQGGQGHESIPPMSAAQSRPFMPRQNDGEHDFSWCADYEKTENFGVARIRGDRPCALVPHPVHQALVIAFPLQGILEAIVGEDSITARPGQALLLSASHAAQTIAHPDPVHAHVAMFFPKIAVSRVYHSRFQNSYKENTEINSIIELDTPIGNSLYYLAKTALSDLFGKQYFKQSAEASRLVTELALHIVFDGRTKQLGMSADEKAAPYVHRAVEFIHGNLHRPMTISTIAEAVGVSARSLQSGFQLAYRITPMAYLRRARLEMVHAELSDPDNFLSVSEVASKWGFTHLSRFSTLYRDEFGVSPSATSRKRR